MSNYSVIILVLSIEYLLFPYNIYIRGDVVLRHDYSISLLDSLTCEAVALISRPAPHAGRLFCSLLFAWFWFVSLSDNNYSTSTILHLSFSAGDSEAYLGSGHPEAPLRSTSHTLACGWILCTDFVYLPSQTCWGCVLESRTPTVFILTCLVMIWYTRIMSPLILCDSC